MRSSLIEHSVWSAEPAAPAQFDLPQFAQALATLCGPSMSPQRAEHYATIIYQNAAKHGEDPFLLGALVYRMSHCKADASESQGIGLTAIQPEMIRDNVMGDMLRYRVVDGGQWVERAKILSRPPTETTLLNPEVNIEWAAALLSMWREQHAAMDEHFEQHVHRHYVSHFVWGDRVRSDRDEDRILTDRRRLLAYYGVYIPEATVMFRNLTWGAPLEAGPRVVSSAPGADRDAGLRRHRGVDVEGMHGEPVLAMADGVVFFAGVDLPGHGSQELDPSNIRRVGPARMGKGGRFVCIEHAGAADVDEQYLRSCYMHLHDVTVSTGEVVKRGQKIGTLGRTGIKHSAPHLHLEIRSDKRLYDARKVVPGILVGQPPHEKRRRKRAVPQV